MKKIQVWIPMTPTLAKTFFILYDFFSPMSNSDRAKRGQFRLTWVQIDVSSCESFCHLAPLSSQTRLTPSSVTSNASMAFSAGSVLLWMLAFTFFHWCRLLTKDTYEFLFSYPRWLCAWLLMSLAPRIRLADIGITDTKKSRCLHAFLFSELILRSIKVLKNA